jgi:hypothetical protein
LIARCDAAPERHRLARDDSVGRGGDREREKSGTKRRREVVLRVTVGDDARLKSSRDRSRRAPEANLFREKILVARGQWRRERSTGK